MSAPTRERVLRTLGWAGPMTADLLGMLLNAYDDERDDLRALLTEMNESGEVGAARAGVALGRVPSRVSPA